MLATENVYPASVAQRRLWFTQQLHPESCAYTLGQVFLLTGTLDLPALEKAVIALADRHRSLRTRFAEHDGVPLQIVDPVWRGEVVVTEQGTANEFVHTVFTRPFDLTVDTLLRVDVLRESANRHVLAITAHHIVTDGVSANIVLRDLATLYNGGRLDEVTSQYTDLLAEDGDLDYWLEHIDGAPMVLPLPTRDAARGDESFLGRYVDFDVPDDLTHELKTFARASSATLYMVAFAAYQVLLSRLSGEQDLLVGMPISGRTAGGSEDVVGFFVNTLPVRADLRADPAFTELVTAVRTNVLEAFMHQDVPVDRIVEAVNPPRQMGMNPLIQATFQLFEEAVGTELSLSGLDTIALPVPVRDVPFDLSIDLYHVDGRLRGMLYYRQAALDEQMADQIITTFLTVLRAAVTSPDTPVSTLPLSGAQQPAALPVTTEAVLALDRLAELDADHVVLVRGERRWTAAQLRRDVRAVAGALPQDSVVGVPGPLSYRALVSVLGTWSAGAVVLPADHAEADLVFSGEIPDREAPAVSSPRAEAPALLLPGDSATAVVTHGAFAALLAAHRETTEEQRVFLAEDIWDFAPWRALVWLLSGAEVHLPVGNESSGIDVHTSADAGASAGHHASRTKPSGADIRESAASNLHTVTASAEFPARYGPIECLGHALIRPDGDPHHTVPAAGVTVRILDPAGRPVPAGVAGDLWVGGNHIALGYLGDTALTAARFRPDPLSAGRLVHTGARARLTPAGRVHLLTTTDLPGHSSETEFAAPRGGAEHLVAAVMAHVLGRDQVSRHDHFFECGGHSVLAMQLTARLRSMLQSDISVRVVFENPTVAGLAAALAETAHLPASSPQAGEAPERAPVSFAQQRLWFIHQLDPTSTAYNMYEPVRITGSLDVTALAIAVEQLVARHESLRTRFTEVDGELLQVVDDTWAGALEIEDVEDSDHAQRRLADLVDTPFDLVRGPLFRANLFRIGQSDHLFAPSMHHIVSDGHSITVLMSDLAKLYEAALTGTEPQLPVLPVRYADYATWQRGILRDELLDAQLSYWTNQIGDAPHRLPLPADHAPDGPPSIEGGVARFELPPEVTVKLRERAHGQGATLFMLTLAAFEVLLARISGQPNFLVGVPVAGRTQPELEDLIGFFVNTLAVRADLRADPTFTELVKETRDRVLAGFAHQELPFERLVEAVNPERVAGTNPLVQVTFHLFEDDLTGGLRLPGTECGPVETFNRTARFDLALDLFRTGQGLSGSLYYRRDMFTHATAQQIADCYRELLIAVLAGPDRPVSAFPVDFERVVTAPVATGTRRPVRDEFVAPLGPVEQVVAGIMGGVLGVGQVGRFDDFFVLGGHSLRAVQLAARLQSVLQVEVNVVTVFENPTVDTLAAAVAEATQLTTPPLCTGLAPDSAPVSFAQQRLWFMQQLESESTAYNMYSPIRVHGRLDRAALLTAVDRLARRHEALRTRFTDVDGVLCQVVDDEWSGRVEFASGQEIQPWLEELIDRPFDLENGPLFQADVLRIADDDHLLTLSMHHILSDGRSMTVLLSDLSAFYNAALTGARVELPELPVRYADFAVWQRDVLQGELLDRHLAYWTEHVAGAPQVLRLPSDQPPVETPSFEGGAARFDLDAELVGRLRDLASRCDATLFMVVLSAFQVLLSRLTGEPDLLVGVPVGGRTRPEVEDVVGFFINTLPIRSDLRDDPLFTDLVDRTRDGVLMGFAHQELPFERLVEAVNPERVLGSNPLVQATCQLFEDELIVGLDLDGTTSEYFPAFNDTARFDLSLDLYRVGDGMHCSLYFRRDLLSQQAADRIAENYQTLLAEVAGNASRHVSELPLATEDEHESLLQLGDGTSVPANGIETILDLFAEQVAARPDAIAVSGRDDRLTFVELDEMASLIAAQLRRRGVRHGDHVALAAARTPKLVAGVLGVLRAGAVLVSLDHGQPVDRLAAVLAAAKPVCLVVDGATVGLADQFGLPALDVTVLPAASFEGAAPIGADLAYVVFTSGSTGTPKGVLVEHRALANLVCGHQETQYPVAIAAAGKPRLKVAHTSSIAFDAAWDQILWMIAGHELHVVDDDVRKDSAALVALLAEQRVDVLNTTPTFMEQLVHEGLLEQSASKPSFLVLGGEAVRPSLWARLRAEPGIESINCYGPTECTVDALIARLRDSERPVVGTPIPNTSVRVLDYAMRPVPPGVVGEIHLGGPHLARGYLNDPDLTAQRFVQDPSGRHDRLYRTGDLGRFTADGAVEFLGRADRQLKVRGYRIEPGEIESVLLSQPHVRDAVVSVVTEQDSSRLVAHVVVDEGFDDSELRADLVASWQTVFEDAHEAINASDSTDAAIFGWTDSFSGKAIPAPQMREWVDTTIDRILRLQPRRVLEIGAGTGLLMKPLLERTDIERYVATDFSGPVLDVLRKTLDEIGTRSEVLVGQAEAVHAPGLFPGTHDTVVINSVAQYFPSMSYLVRTIENALEVVSPGGHVFLGDLRNAALLEAFVALKHHLLHAGADRARLVELITRELRADGELSVDPIAVHRLLDRFPAVTAIEISPRRGEFGNEMTLFRYDVVLHVGCPAEADPTQWEHDDQLTLGAVERRLAAADAPFGYRGVGNARLAEALSLRDEYGCTPSNATSRATALDLEALWRLGTRYGWHTRISWTGDDSGAIDVSFAPAGTHYELAGPVTGGTAGKTTADPLFPPLLQSTLEDLLVGSVRRALPDYMVPADVVFVTELPRNAGGKVDTTQLARPRRVGAIHRQRTTAQAAARTPLAVVMEVFSRSLRTTVLPEDDFFDLGGDSLTAGLCVRELSSLELDVTIRDLFERRTPARIAELL
ncbi:MULTISPECIES: non-ribosomal peptide synthetase [Streptomyces]|uniref:Non-ribosomal peptide synthetase n=1 Tax=Streptomyces eurythermus TaxID=42237 RepID=A0ABW6Z972_9ACTN|nr:MULTISPECIES: non-ribosomal peptide synthetase [Streptomyces]QIS68704.1 non-ribosomal peptide synthetase [Streptomyces sp. DSM 40868]